MLRKQARNTQRRMERLGIRVSAETAMRLIRRERRNRKDKENYNGYE